MNRRCDRATSATTRAPRPVSATSPVFSGRHGVLTDTVVQPAGAPIAVRQPDDRPRHRPALPLLLHGVRNAPPPRHHDSVQIPQSVLGYRMVEWYLQHRIASGDRASDIARDSLLPVAEVEAKCDELAQRGIGTRGQRSGQPLRKP